MFQSVKETPIAISTGSTVKKKNRMKYGAISR